MQALYTSDQGFTPSTDPKTVAAWLRDKADDGTSYRIVADALLNVDFSEGALDLESFTFDTTKRNGTQGFNVTALAPTFYTVKNTGRLVSERGMRWQTSISEQALRDRTAASILFEFAGPFQMSGAFAGSLYADQDLTKPAAQSTGIGVTLSRIAPNVDTYNCGFQDFAVMNFWRGLFTTNEDEARRNFTYFRRGAFSNMGISCVVVNMPGAKGAGKQAEHVEFNSITLNQPASDIAASVALGSSSCRGVNYKDIFLKGRHKITLSFEETDNVTVNGVYGEVQHSFISASPKTTHAVLHVKSNNISTGGAYIPNKNLNIENVFVTQNATVRGDWSNGIMVGSGTPSECWDQGRLSKYKFDGFNKDFSDAQTGGPKNYVIEAEGY